MSQSWVSQKERSNPFTLRLICWIALNISRPFARLWLYPITLYFLLTSPKVRRSSHHYLRRIPNKKGNLIEITKHIYCFAATVLDRVYFLTNQQHLFDINIHGKEIMDEVIKSKKGCILLGAHVGSFEALRCLAISHEHLPLKIMIHQNHNAMITKILDELNPEITQSIINLSDDDALFQMKESIDDGQLIGILGDRILPGVKQIECELLGDKIAMPVGPITLGSVLHVPIIVFYGLYEGGNRYSVHIEKLRDAKVIPRKKRDAVVAQTIHDYTSNIEAKIIQNPYNWFNFYDFWNDNA